MMSKTFSVQVTLLPGQVYNLPTTYQQVRDIDFSETWHASDHKITNPKAFSLHNQNS